MKPRALALGTDRRRNPPPIVGRRSLTHQGPEREASNGTPLAAYTHGTMSEVSGPSRRGPRLAFSPSETALVGAACSIMSPEQSDNSDSVPGKRRLVRGRVHPSTGVALAIALLFLFLPNVPGQIVVGPDIFAPGKYGPHFECYERCEHGWPLTYLWREPVEFSTYPFWRLSLWNLSQGVDRWSTTRFLADVAIAILVLLVTGVAFEAWGRRRRAIYQFHVVDLLVLVLVCSVALGRLAAELRERREEQRLLKAIGETKSDVEWGCSVEERAEWERGGPSWLRRIVGDRCFRFLDRVVGLDVTGAELKHAVRLRHLKVLRIKWSATKADIKLLENVPKLEALDASFLERDIENDKELLDYDDPRAYELDLPNLPYLRGLNGYDSPFSARGLERLTRIEVLYISGEGADLKQVACLSRLKELYLPDTAASDSDLRHLAGLQQLEQLWLGFNRLSDAGLAHLAALPNLRMLDLAYSDVTDEGLDLLKGLSKLECLDLTETKVTDAGVNDLQQALPDCYIIH